MVARRNPSRSNVAAATVTMWRRTRDSRSSISASAPTICLTLLQIAAYCQSFYTFSQIRVLCESLHSQLDLCKEWQSMTTLERPAIRSRVDGGVGWVTPYGSE